MGRSGREREPEPDDTARELFIYYRVAPGSVPAALAAATQLQTELRAARPGLQTRLLRRPQDSTSTQTWMETYAMREGCIGGITAEIEAEIASRAAAMSAWIDGPRRVEVFVDCTN